MFLPVSQSLNRIVLFLNCLKGPAVMDDFAFSVSS